MRLKIIVWIISAVILSSLGQSEFASATTTSSIPKIYFAEGSTNISLLSRKKLNTIIKLLKSQPESSIAIIGHKDHNECQNVNKPLALQRAQGVKSYLKANGIDESKLHVKGSGCAQVTTSSLDASDKLALEQLNRRVEFEIR